MSDNTTKAHCKHCFYFLAAGSNSTLRNHFMIPYCEALKTVPEAGQSSMDRDECLFVYNPDVVHEQFVGLVIQEGLPFNHFDNTRMTRVFQNQLQPKYNHAKERFNDSFQGLYNTYDLKYGNPTQSTNAASSSRSHSGNPMTSLLNKLKESSNKRARNDHLASSEYERYVTSDFVSHLSTEELAAFESAFSTSERVLSIRRTRLTPASLNICMCLKDHLDATDRIQHTSNLENLLDFEEEILEKE
nr:zinc finger BED domain-containing protein RICESLEEPER 2 [Tanacetum cinerariifolium]